MPEQARSTGMPTTADDATSDGGVPVLADRYELGAVLGRGGMAEVYRGFDRLLARDVAVKMLRDSADHDSDRARFTGEARTLARLSHSGLVMVLDAGISAEHPYLVMELVDGPTLARVLEAGPLDVVRARSIGVQLADALAYAHQRGVVHRDVKPGNVLLGADDRVKLADFGIARLLGDTVRHTRTGQAIGTAAYLAPEQVMGRDVDGAADVYSLGLVLLEAVTGDRAYPGPPTEAAVARLSRQPEVPAQLPPDLRALLVAMTALEPQDRPTAAEVAAGLRAQPTGPIPAATVRDVAAVASAPPPDATRQLTDAGSVTVAAPAAPPAPSAAGTPTGTPGQRPLPDRAGDALATRARDLARRARATPPHLKAVAAAIGVLLVLIVVVAVAGSSGGSRDDLPPNTPTRLQQPLRQLHDAVNGGG